MSKIIKNPGASPVTVNDVGVTIPGVSSYTIPPQDYLLWAASSDIISSIGSLTLIINDGSFDLTVSDGVDLIKGLFPSTLVQNPINAQVALTLANTEYSYSIPALARRIEIRIRELKPLKLGFGPGESITNYRSIPAGYEYAIDGIATGHNIIFYFQSSYPTTTLEITYYT